MRIIETFQDQSADFVQTIELDGIVISMRLVFNTRSESWYINEYQELDTDKKLYGIKLVKSYPLIFAMKTRIDLPGDFMVIKEDESIEDEITYDNLNKGWNLYYMTALEIAAWRLENGI